MFAATIESVATARREGLYRLLKNLSYFDDAERETTPVRKERAGGQARTVPACPLPIFLLNGSPGFQPVFEEVFPTGLAELIHLAESEGAGGTRPHTGRDAVFKDALAVAFYGPGLRAAGIPDNPVG
jgi:hypothetical protein